MTRSELRKNIFKIIFRMDFHPKEEMEEQLSMRLAELLEEGTKEEDIAYIRDKSKAIMDSVEELDAVIAAYSKGWKVERLGKTELAILRVAAYEILKDDDIPKSVAINEAVELAKAYSPDEAPRFINGILAKLA
ncbi:MAG: transcription antitermination factor NusB [Lachnospiraceae bacterium]|nr:transcription antitermination factor NusB [Lachnospiraceae bacterium]